MKIVDFIKFYFSKTIKCWWISIVLIPPFIILVSKLDSFYFESRYSDQIQRISNWLAPWWIWVAVIIFWFAHLKVIYGIWKDRENQNDLTQLDSIPESYTNVVRTVENLMPKESQRIRKSFTHGYKCLTGSKGCDIKTAISIHFNAYKIIYDFLITYLSSENASVQITVEMSQIRVKFEQNFSQLKNYNNIIGQNDSLPVEKLDIQKLINHINDNLNSLFAYLL